MGKRKDCTTNDSNSDNTDTESDEKLKKERRRKEKKKKQKKSKKKRRRRSSSSSDDDSVSGDNEKRHSSTKKKKKKSKKKKTKDKKLKTSNERPQSPLTDTTIGPLPPSAGESSLMPDNVPEAASSSSSVMAPMTKEAWEKRQSQIRRVFDETTGRHRLIRGDGEVLEEIVSRDRHRAINNQATLGDGLYFQSKIQKKL